MWKFVGVLALAVASFGLGYYFGQRPVGTLEHGERRGRLLH